MPWPHELLPVQTIPLSPADVSTTLLHELLPMHCTFAVWPAIARTRPFVHELGSLQVIAHDFDAVQLTPLLHGLLPEPSPHTIVQTPLWQSTGPFVQLLAPVHVIA